MDEAAKIKMKMMRDNEMRIDEGRARMGKIH